MTVKIVTDTLSDIPDEIANQLGITLIPLTVSFGRESFLDRIEITSDSHPRFLLPTLIKIWQKKVMKYW